MLSDIRRAVSALKPELVELTLDLVRTPSVTGDEDEAQSLLAERLGHWDLTIDRFRPNRQELIAHPAYCDDGLPVERENLVASWGEPSKDVKAALILNGHIDVVPPGERDEWRYEPFDAHVADDHIHGRGACDMKGGLAAAAIAIRAAQKLGWTPDRPIRLEAVTGEETGGVGTLATILRGYRADAAVITEPTKLHMCPVQAGALSFRLRIPGKAAHGAMRESGINAIEKLWPVWQALSTLESTRHRAFHHPLFPPDRLVAPLSIGRVRAGNWPSTVPELLTAEGRFGVFPGEKCETARSQMEESLAEVCEQDEWLRHHPIQIEWFEGQFEPGQTHDHAAILGQLADCHREVTTQEICSEGVSYGSDLRLFTEHAAMPAVLYGPGDVRLAHAANESVPIEEMLRTAEVLTLLIHQSLKSGSR